MNLAILDEKSRSAEENPIRLEMSKSFQVLIIEDDRHLAEALQRGLKAKEIDVYVAQTPEAAQTLCSHCDFSLIISDCMLPRMDGVTLVQKLFSHFSKAPDILLMTGVFKDKSFISEALKKTGADEILSKPFELNDFVNKVLSYKKKFDEKQKSIFKTQSLIDFFTKKQTSADSLVEFYTENPSLDGREIPFVLSLLLESQWVGALHLQFADTRTGVIYISKGQVSQVFLDDSTSLLGHLLMDLGFVEPEDLENALSSKDRSLIGQKLINQLSISPHALDLALSEQTVIRLSQLIAPEILQIRVSAGAQPPKNKVQIISEKRLDQLFHEWGESKYDRNFLEEFFEFCMDQPLSDGRTFRDFLTTEEPGNAIERLLKRELIPPAPKSVRLDESHLKEKYRRLDESLRAKNLFEVLGLSNRALSKEVEKAYFNIKSSMATNLNTTNDPELLEIKERINSKVEKAYSILMDDIKRGHYINQLKTEGMQKLFQKEPEYNLAVSLIHAGKFRDAHTTLQRLSNEKYNFPDLVTYLIIARARHQRVSLQEAELLKVSPENRQSGAYMLAKGFCHKGTKNYPMAIQYFRRALVYIPDSQLAQKEIASCMRRLQRQKDAQGGSLIQFFLGSSNKKVS